MPQPGPSWPDEATIITIRVYKRYPILKYFDYLLMSRPAKIISLNSLPKLTLREETGKLRQLDLDCITLPAAGEPAYLITVFNLLSLFGKSVDLQLNKNSGKYKLIEEGNNLALRLLKAGAAKFNEQDAKSTTLYSNEEVDELRQAYREPHQEVVDGTRTISQKLRKYLAGLPQTIKCTFLWLKGILIVVQSNVFIPVVFKHLDSGFSCIAEQLVGQFLMLNCTEIEVSLSQPYFDMTTCTEKVQVALSLKIQIDLVRKGWASVRADARQSINSDEFALMLEAEAIAKKEFRGVWKMSFDVFKTGNYQEAFEAIVHQVVQGHQYKLRKGDGTIINFQLERVVCPTHQQTGAYECSQFARKTLIGRQVIVWLERNAKLSVGIARGLVALQEEMKFVDVMLMEKGLGVIRDTLWPDNFTVIFKNIERINKEEKVGIYSNDIGVFRFQDLTKLQRKTQRALAKQFGERVILEDNNPHYAAVVENIRRSDSYQLKLPFHRAIILVKLQGVDTLNSLSKKSQYTKFKEESNQYLTDKLLQRDVEVQLLHFDDDLKTFIGRIVLNKRNLTEDLLAEGLLYIADPDILEEYLPIQENAQKLQKGLWDPSLIDILNERQQQEVETISAIVSYVEGGNKIYYQKPEYLEILENKINPVLQTLDAKTMNPIPYERYDRIGGLIIAPFQGSLYRAVIEQDLFIRNKREKQLNNHNELVYFVDYGNHQIVSKKQIFMCPQAIHDYNFVADLAQLSFTQPIESNNELSEQALDYISDELISRGVPFIFVFKKVAGQQTKRRMKQTLVFEKQSADITKSINFQFVAKGVLKIDKKNLAELLREDEWAELLRLETQAKKKSAYLWFQECENDPQGEQLMKMKGFNSAMRSHF